MSNFRLHNLLKKNAANAVFFIVLAWVISFSFATLTTKPKLWIDEAKSIELARNFAHLGKLDIQTAPGEFSGFPQLLQSTGYPILVPLAAIFKMFGYGLTQARAYMVFWMVLSLLVVLLFSKNVFGKRDAIFSVLLISTFASFYDSGRTVVGEIPGFLFLIAGMYTLLKKEAYYLTGVLWGIAVVTKPSVFGLIVPAIFIVSILDWRSFFPKLWKIALGMAPAALAWIFLVLDNPFLKSAWISIFNFYQNPYSSAFGNNVMQNIKNIPHSTTLIYFGFLFAIIVIVRFLVQEKKLVLLYNFVIIYSLLAFGYYLRSPGWLR